MRALMAVFISLGLFFSQVAVAEKPDWAGKGKPAGEQKAEHKAMMKAREAGDDNETEAIEEKMKKAKSMDKERNGLKKQAEKKNQEARKEVGKGSEKGQQSREQHSRKWWKFWQSDDDAS